MDRDNLGFLQEFFDRFGEVIAESRNASGLDYIVAKDLRLEPDGENS